VIGDVGKLRAFTLVVDLGSISAAANVLGYTQSAVSQQIAALERESGAVLIDRSQRPLRATAAGLAVRPLVDAVLVNVAGAERVLEDLRVGTTRLRLAAFPGALSAFVPPAVRELRRTHPDVSVQVVQLETREAVEALRAGGTDLAVVHYLPGVPAPDTSGLGRHHLLDDELHVVLATSHRLARREAVSVSDLEGEPLILPRRDTPAGRFRSLVERLCADAGFRPEVAYELDDLPAAQAFAAAGIGIVVMHELTLATLPHGASARPLVARSGGARTVEALTPKTPTPVAAWLLGQLKAAVLNRRLP
jgi:DNA-binding transcriptional LysR family regulator